MAPKRLLGFDNSGQECETTRVDRKELIETEENQTQKLTDWE